MKTIFRNYPEVGYTIMANIKTIKLSDGSVYSIFDNGALRINEQGYLVTGNGVVDKKITCEGLYVIEIDETPVSDGISNLVTAIQQSDGRWEFKRRSVDKVLEDIGGTSSNIQDGILTLKIGK